MTYPEVDMNSLGYWSVPFILEDHVMDNHKMITYSFPLVFDGIVYGVMGTEVPSVTCAMPISGYRI